VLEGEGVYQVDEAGNTVPITAGDVVVAHAGSVHGVLNTGLQPLSFISVVCPAEAGFVLL
jgi:mannose-6-phosphate isomerase-like protein (cupin superfamily)